MLSGKDFGARFRAHMVFSVRIVQKPFLLQEMERASGSQTCKTCTPDTEICLRVDPDARTIIMKLDAWGSKKSNEILLSVSI